MQKWLEKTERELIIRGYSRKTVDSYVNSLRRYFRYKKNTFEILDVENIRSFLLQMHKKNYAGQTVNLYLNAIRFFYREVEKQPVSMKLKFSRKSKKLPVILSRTELQLIFDSLSNLKHKLMLSLAYGSGLRVNEVVTLKVKDIMLKGKSLPICSPEEKILDVLISLSNKQCGCLLVLNSEKELLGIFTDGDLRRAFVSFGEEALQKEVKSAMTLSPRTVGQDTFAWEALKKMEEVPNSPVTVLPVIKNKRAIGIVKMHDILQAGI